MKVNEIFEESSLVCELPVKNCPVNINEISKKINKEMQSLKEECEQNLRIIENIIRESEARHEKSGKSE